MKETHTIAQKEKFVAPFSKIEDLSGQNGEALSEIFTLLPEGRPTSKDILQNALLPDGTTKRKLNRFKRKLIKARSQAELLEQAIISFSDGKETVYMRLKKEEAERLGRVMKGFSHLEILLYNNLSRHEAFSESYLCQQVYPGVNPRLSQMRLENLIPRLRRKMETNSNESVQNVGSQIDPKFMIVPKIVDKQDLTAEKNLTPLELHLYRALSRTEPFDPEYLCNRLYPGVDRSLALERLAKIRKSLSQKLKSSTGEAILNISTDKEPDYMIVKLGEEKKVLKKFGKLPSLAIFKRRRI